MVNVEYVEKRSELQWESKGVLTSKLQQGEKVCSVLLELKSNDDTYQQLFVYLFAHGEPIKKRGHRTGFTTDPECCPPASKAQ